MSTQTDHPDFDALNRLLHQRYSCRAYRPDALPDATIAQIVTTAGRVPSWCNAQPWQVHVTRRDQTNALRQALYAKAQTGGGGPDIAFPAAYEGVYKARRATCGWALYGALGIEKGDRAASGAQMMENFRLFGAPHFALVTTEAALGPYAVLDCGAFVTAFTLAAEALGVGSIPQAAVAGFSGFMRDWFNVPSERHIVCGISFGLADPDHPANSFRTERAPLSEVLHWSDAE